MIVIIRVHWYTNVLKNGSVINKKFLNGWSKDNPNSTIPALTIDDGGRNTAANDFWLQNASFLRMKNIQLGYTLPTSWTKNFQMQRVRFYVSAENLLTITGYEGMDPDNTWNGLSGYEKSSGWNIYIILKTNDYEKDKVINISYLWNMYYFL